MVCNKSIKYTFNALILISLHLIFVCSLLEFSTLFCIYSTISNWEIFNVFVDKHVFESIPQKRVFCEIESFWSVETTSICSFGLRFWDSFLGF